jgi:hypothetical protein
MSFMSPKGYFSRYPFVGEEMKKVKTKKGKCEGIRKTEER